jgi:hypothetical protein
MTKSPAGGGGLGVRECKRVPVPPESLPVTGCARIRFRAGKAEKSNVLVTGRASCPENSSEDEKSLEYLSAPRSASRGKNEDGR